MPVHPTIEDMKKLILIIILFASALIVAGCYYDNETILYGAEECKTDSVTYSGAVKEIIQQNCLSCHSQAMNSGGITLETQAQLKAQADNGNLVGAITHSSGYSPMPKNSPQLSDCDIEVIRTWVESGALNN